eukprot:TRINITY_DN585_c0_g1_i1.p2 TRINITY_DN585_c0_g1~~TRINITY_DN585_c0_g1_i1.p2  ORF type:complete len:218 (+),score=55.35 TRINITY_DN585_c0_g1_i1:84-656(+)
MSHTDTLVSGVSSLSHSCTEPQWLSGVVSSIGDIPTITTPTGNVVRFAFRSLKRFGGPKVMLAVGDEVHYLLGKGRRYQNSFQDRATQVRVKHSSAPRRSHSGSHQSVGTDVTPTGSDSPRSLGYTASTESPTQGQAVFPPLSTHWVHDPYSWEASTCIVTSSEPTVTYCGEQSITVAGHSIVYDRFISV